MINYKTFEDVSLIFFETWVLVNEIMLNIKQNSEFVFLKNEFWAVWGLRFKFQTVNFDFIEKDRKIFISFKLFHEDGVFYYSMLRY